MKNFFLCIRETVLTFAILIFNLTPIGIARAINVSLDAQEQVFGELNMTDVIVTWFVQFTVMACYNLILVLVAAVTLPIMVVTGKDWCEIKEIRKARWYTVDGQVEEFKKKLDRVE